MLKWKFDALLILIKFHFNLLLGKIFGITYVIRYIRNPDPIITVKLLREFGAKIGERTTIKRTIYLDNVYEDKNSIGDFSNLKIGINCYIGDCAYFDLSNEIIIGNNVVISGGVSFVTHADCNRSVYLEKVFPRKCKKIVVQDGAWIGFKATILNGVTIKRNSVVAAHSLVKKDVEEYCFYAGLPAEKIRNIKDSHTIADIPE